MTEQDLEWQKSQLYVIETLRNHSAQLDKINDQLFNMNTTLTKMEAQRSVAKWVTGIVLPGGVAIAFSALARKLGF